MGILLDSGKSYFADLRMTFRQKFFLQDWFRNKLRVGLGYRVRVTIRVRVAVWNRELVLVKPLLCYVLSL
jgi:hypothetical protein